MFPIPYFSSRDVSCSRPCAALPVSRPAVNKLISLSCFRPHKVFKIVNDTILSLTRVIVNLISSIFHSPNSYTILGNSIFSSVHPTSLRNSPSAILLILTGYGRVPSTRARCFQLSGTARTRIKASAGPVWYDFFREFDLTDFFSVENLCV